MTLNICRIPSWVIADQIADTGGVGTEGQLAGGGGLDPHLVLDAGRHDSVALADRAVLVHHELRDDEHRKALCARAGALGAGQYEVNDVVGVVAFAGSDEALDTLDVIDALFLVDRDGLGRAGADIGAGVRLGEHHRRAPSVVQHRLDEPLDLLLGAGLVEHVAHQGADHEEERAWVGADHEFLGGPTQRRRSADATEGRGTAERVPALLVVRLDGLHDPRREGDLPVDKFDLGPVTLFEALREHIGRESLNLGKEVTGGIGIHVGVRSGAEVILHPVRLEQIELDVSKVRLVVAHLNPLAQVRAKHAVFRF